MCLNNKKRVTTDKDITCYKVFEVRDNGELRTPFRNSKYELGKLRKLKREEVPFPLSSYIASGAFHSFMTRKGARVFATGYKKRHVCIVKCKIPKESKYIYKGYFDGYGSYGSQQIFPVMIVEAYSNGKRVV